MINQGLMREAITSILQAAAKRLLTAFTCVKHLRRLAFSLPQNAFTGGAFCSVLARGVRGLIDAGRSAQAGMRLARHLLE